jgi:predicted dehydrogenase
MSVLGIGMAGYGGIGKLHTLAYRSIPSYYPNFPKYRLAAVCTRSEKSAATAAAEGGFAKAYTNLQDMVNDPDVHVVDCVLPNDAHREAVFATLKAGKSIYCEKPLALTGAEARELAAVAAASVGTLGMTFNYRFVPALQKARRLVESGALGDIYRFHAEYLHTGYQDPSRPLSWRMKMASSGGGAIMDLGSHIIDLVRFLVGEFASVSATTKTYITQRPLAKGSAETGPVDVDDAAWLQAVMKNGATGTLTVSRFATGSADDLRLIVEGSKGAFRFDLMDANWLYWFDATRKSGEAGWTRLETIQTYEGAVVPPARAILGWDRTHAENQYQFLKSVVERTAPSPGIVDGLNNNLVMDAAYTSAREQRWVKVAEL